MRLYKLTMDDMEGHGAYLVGLFMEEPSGVELLFSIQYPLDTAPAPLSTMQREHIVESLLSNGCGGVGIWQFTLDEVKL